MRISSEQAWPETCTGAISWCSTSAPAFASRLIESWTRSSLPGNRLRRDDHGVASLDRDRRVVVVRDPRQRRHRLALAARAEDHHLAGRQLHRLLRLDQDVLRHVEVAERARDVQVLAHRAADDRDLAPDLDRDVDRLLHPVHVRGEARRRGCGPCAAASASGTPRRRGARSRSSPAARRSSSRPGGGRRPGCRARRTCQRPSSGRRPACGRASSRPCGRRARPWVSSTIATQSGIECATRTKSSVKEPTLIGFPVSASCSCVEALKPVLVELRLDQPERQLRPDHLVAVDLAEEVRQPADVVLVPVGEDDRVTRRSWR